MTKGSHAAYNDGLKAINQQRVEIALLLHNHAFEAHENDFPWSYSGDLEHVSELFRQIISFLRGED